MRITYETGIVTFIQFVTGSLLAIANNIYSIVSTCHSSGNDCVSNSIISLIYILVEIFAFAFIWILGFAAQNRRSRPLARLLILIELVVIGVTLINIKGWNHNLLSLFTSLLDLALALWVILLAWRLSHANGGRVVTHARVRQRKHTL